MKPMKTEDGQQYPAEAYAYVPDPEKPSTWKLRLWEDPEKKVTASQVGAAVAALGKGFRGNKVDIPSEDLGKVKSKIREAWQEANPDKSAEDMPDVLKKQRLRSVIKQWFAGEGWSDDDDEPAQAHDMTTALQMDAYSDQLLGTLTAALADTIDSITDDPTVTDKQPLVQAALQDYSNRLQAVGITKAGRKISSARLDNLKQIHQSLGDLIDGVLDPDNMSGNEPDPEEANKHMQIDKSKLPADVRKYIEDLEEKVSKSAPSQPQQTEEEIMKASLPEPLRKRFEEMEKQAKQAEEIAKRERDERIEREFVAKASSFQGLAVQPDEFGKVMKSLHESNPEAFAKVEDVLKAADTAIAQSGLFAEVGKGGAAMTDAAEKLDSIAKTKVEKSGGKLSYAKAYDEAIQENPDLYVKQKEGK